MNGTHQLLVPVFSAASDRLFDDPLPIKRSHSNMVKFFGVHDSEWKNVCRLLKRLVASVRNNAIKEVNAGRCSSNSATPSNDTDTVRN